MGGRNYDGRWARTPGRVVGTALVRSYQLTLSPLIGQSCRHLPTCSEFAFEAIARHGLWAGGWMAVGRVARCGPFGSHGFDPVPTAAPAGWRRWWPPAHWRRPVDGGSEQG